MGNFLGLRGVRRTNTCSRRRRRRLRRRIDVRLHRLGSLRELQVLKSPARAGGAGEKRDVRTRSLT